MGSLSYEGFKNVFVSQLSRRLEDAYGEDSIEVKEVIKDNDVVLHSVSLKNNNNSIMPCIYINDMYRFYNEGGNLDGLIEEIKNYFEGLKYKRFTQGDLPDFDVWENVAPYISCRLINSKANIKRLQGAPIREIGEFSLAYQVKVDDGRDGFYMAQIRDEMMSGWGITEEELYKAAVTNMKMPLNFVLRSMREMLNLPYDNGLFILTTNTQIYGATVIISSEVREIVGKYVGGDYYVLPSSIHEVIIVPKKKAVEIPNLLYIVREVNRGPYVGQAEFLSDNVYEYSTSDKAFRMVGENKKLM